jgi:hypothetical protein
MTVWTGSNRGDLQVWVGLPVKGLNAAETIFYSGEIDRVEKRSVQRGVLQLLCGTLTWSWRDKREFHNLSISFRNLRLDWKESAKDSTLDHKDHLRTSSFSFDQKRLSAQLTTFQCTDTSKHTVFIFKSQSIEEAQKWRQMIAMGMRWASSDWVLVERASRKLSNSNSHDVAILSIAEIGGLGWTVDAAMRLTEWAVEKDFSGIHRKALRINPLRQVNLDLHRVGLSCMWSGSVIQITEHQLWVVTGDQLARIEIGSQGYDPVILHHGFISRLRYSPSSRKSAHFKEELINSILLIRLDRVTEIWSSNSAGDIIFWNPNGDIIGSLTVGDSKSFVCTMCQINDEVMTS